MSKRLVKMQKIFPYDGVEGGVEDNTIKLHKIIEISKKYNFYGDWIPLALKKWKYELYNWGFIIWGENYFADGMLNVEYFFVLPQYRRKGILTKYLRQIRKEYLIISFTSSSEAMNSFATKANFKNFGKTRSGNEIWYVWSETYTDDELKQLR